MLVAVDPLERLRQVGLHRLLQLQPGAAAEQRQPGVPAQAVEALPQAGVGPAWHRPRARAWSPPGRRGSDRRARSGQSRAASLAESAIWRPPTTRQGAPSRRSSSPTAAGSTDGRRAATERDIERECGAAGGGRQRRARGEQPLRRADVRYRRSAVTARLPRGRRAFGEVEAGRHGADPAALHQLVFVVVGLGDLGVAGCSRSHCFSSASCTACAARASAEILIERRVSMIVISSDEGSCCCRISASVSARPTRVSGRARPRPSRGRRARRG